MESLPEIRLPHIDDLLEAVTFSTESINNYISAIGSCDAPAEGENVSVAKKWTCCKADNKPKWCGGSESDEEDGKKDRDGKDGRRGKKDKDGEDDSESSDDEKDGKGKRGKRGKKGKGTFRDELDEDWTR